jgi:aryl-alcohol dehydrogenase-like predicted oxidoreductase
MVSELGLGTAGFWGKRAFPESRSLALVHAAIERGVNFFDTGANYSGGQAEIRLGKILKEHKGANLVVGTKAGSYVASDGRQYRDFSPDAVRRGVEESLRKLNLEQVALLHLHGPAGDHITDELLRCLEDLKHAGLVGFCGVNGGTPDTHRLVLENDVLSTVMFDYNLLRADRRSAISELVDAGKGFIAATPLAQGHFSNQLFKPTRPADLWYLARAFGKHRASLRRGFDFRFVNDYPGWTGSEIAIACTLSNQEVSTAVFGTTSLERLKQNLRTADRPLPQEIVDRI